MDAEQVLKLFDTYWFGSEIFAKQRSSLSPLNATALQVQEEHEVPKISHFPTIQTRSQSEQSLISTASLNSDSTSPKSVLVSPKLRPIFSGKEVLEVKDRTARQEEDTKIPSTIGTTSRKGRNNKGNNKSLSELESEELKGFMDLGFVFSEEDKNSSLVSILPGLQRLGMKDGEEERVDESKISRPYLSEAWAVMDRRREEKLEKPFINWRIPAFAKDIDMKEHLRSWAREVASAIR